MKKYQISSIQYQVPKIILFCLFLGLGFWNFGLGTSFAQSAKEDSLKNVIHFARNDTVLLNALSDLGWEIRGMNPDSAISLGRKALSISEKLSLAPMIARCNSEIGTYYFLKGDYANTLKHYFTSLSIREKIDDKLGKATTLGNMGMVYYKQNNIPVAMKYYKQSLELNKEIGNRIGEASNLGNIGNIYSDSANYDLAIINYQNALKIYLELKLEKEYAYAFGSIGLTFADMAGTFEKSNIQKRDSLLNLALGNYFKAIEIHSEYFNKSSIAINYINISKVYFKKNDLILAKKYLDMSFEKSDSLKAIDILDDVELGYVDYYLLKEDYKLAFEHYKKYIIACDSINNEENTNKQTRIEMTYEFEKKEAAAKAEADKQQAVAEAEKQRQRIVLILVSCVLLLVIVFAGFIFRALRITQKQKRIIEQQKKVVEEKQNEILASIRYAKRIQDAILPKEKYIHKTLERLRAKMPE